MEVCQRLLYLIGVYQFVHIQINHNLIILQVILVGTDHQKLLQI